MSLSPTYLVIFGVVNFIMSIFSSMAGGGAGFVTMPVMLALGLSPAQAVATGKLTGLAATGGSLHGMRSIKPSSRSRLIAIMLLALVIGLVSPYFITKLNSDVYKTVLGVALLVMTPVVIWKKVGLQPHRPSRSRRIVGYIALVAAMMLQAVFSGGLGTLVPIVLMSLLGMPALEANVTKRYSQIILNVVVVITVFVTARHLFVWQVGAIGIVTALIGSAIGSRIAVRRGNGFVMVVTVTLMAFSGLWLIFYS